MPHLCMLHQVWRIPHILPTLCTLWLISCLLRDAHRQLLLRGLICVASKTTFVFQSFTIGWQPSSWDLKSRPEPELLLHWCTFTLALKSQTTTYDAIYNIICPSPSPLSPSSPLPPSPSSSPWSSWWWCFKTGSVRTSWPQWFYLSAHL